MNHVYVIESNNFDGGKTVKECKNAKIHWDLCWHRLRFENLPFCLHHIRQEKKLVKMKCTFSKFDQLQKNVKNRLLGIERGTFEVRFGF